MRTGLSLIHNLESETERHGEAFSDQGRPDLLIVESSRAALIRIFRAMLTGPDHGFVKVLTIPGKDRILGVTIVGEHAGDLIAEYVLAMKHGLGLNKILGTIHIYPTLAEANKYAAGN